MAKINIVIADSDELYLNHLSEYLIEKSGQFDVYSFTAKQSLAGFLSAKNAKIDILAFSEDMDCAEIAAADIPAKVLLSDGAFTQSGTYDCVNKYQKADKFISEILMIFAEKSGRVDAVARGNKKTKMIGFYSPVGGSGKTTFALAAASALGAAGKRVFYLNAERINSVGSILCKGDKGSMSDVYLAVKTKNASVPLSIVAAKHDDPQLRFSYVNPAESTLEINELTAAEFRKLLSAFEELGEFDVVVVDFDSELTKGKISYLQIMDQIIMPFTSEARSLEKMVQFWTELRRYEDLSELSRRFLLC